MSGGQTGSDDPGERGSEKRRETRTPVVLRVDYDGPDELVFDYTDNLSSRGVFLKTARSFAIGDRVRLMLSFPGLLEPIGLEGTVRWTRDEGEAGVGVEFEDGDSRRRIDTLIQQIRDRDPRVVNRLIRVLVVEDNPHVARLIQAGMLGSTERYFGDRLAFNFRTATNGREALDLLGNDTFDALIIDVYLPILDGASVITHVRQNAATRALPIVAVSAGGDSARDSAMAAGADFFIEKPMRLRQLLDTMGKLLDLDEEGESGSTGA
ncbi:TIGR02266 family protein [Haliangium ochraceum]|uniref:Response regulator receiver modulated PilZ sensor protein n=1 Tax=Haliangium ochraceum (strain DSM 14365 / JCM 11303 / SMP-2) TaxID=502025 RepID=D0LQA6_HALO1|nr:TIGR02266 family protein [Haliangium ochraceum]ACY18915.1 response regulator receiver modulated PilZ sensor protein [Haliangium ochraceum DSM 14365]